MSEVTTIAWTDKTFNPWWGCSKVSPGCDHCYAERIAARVGTKWGAGQNRTYFSDAHWKEPERWNARAGARGLRIKVFCASMADVFDNEVPQFHRDRLWDLIERTPYLDWQLLTKRIGNVRSMVPERWLRGFPENVWLGITVVNQEEVERDVRKLFGLLVLRWLSIEPQLERIDLCGVLGMWWNATRKCFESTEPRFNPGRLDWVVVGGESGPKARCFDPHWARLIRDQCKAAGVACFVKQMGSKASTDHRTRPPGEESYWTVMLNTKGDDPLQWPEDLRVREFPVSRAAV